METTSKPKVGIIGGSGLNDPKLFENRVEKRVRNQYGEPSDALICGQIAGVDCVLLARHGRKHDIMPTHVNYRANMFALYNEGCTHVIVTTACGSLKEEVKPGDLVILDDFLDRTTKRDQTYHVGARDGPFKGICHLPMVSPFCEETRQVIIETAKELGYDFHPTGTMVTVEGPRFSTRAESHVFRSWNASTINMTTVPEVVLAKELGLSYASIALVTDYDCWRVGPGVEHVSVSKVLETMKQNSEKAKELILNVIPKIREKNWTQLIAENKKAVQQNVIFIS